MGTNRSDMSNTTFSKNLVIKCIIQLKILLNVYEQFYLVKPDFIINLKKYKYRCLWIWFQLYTHVKKLKFSWFFENDMFYFI